MIRKYADRFLWTAIGLPKKGRRGGGWEGSMGRHRSPMECLGYEVRFLRPPEDHG